MKYLSVCSGIEAATVAWHQLGWEPAGFSEIERFPSQVLDHHYPTVPNLGDMTKYKEWKIGAIDLLVGGTPCQSFSVAGLRKGLDDPRGNLALVYCGILDHYRPQWFVWENVPGVLSSNGGRDFGSFLGALAQLGYGFAYRVLDAEFFGVAQRRRRVFVVGYLGDWRPAAAVLFERTSLSRNPKEGGKKRKEAAKCLTTGVGQRYDPETESLIPETFPTLLSSTAGVSRPGNAATEHETYIPVAIQGNLIGREAGDPQGVGASDKGVMYTLTKADVHGVAVDVYNQAIPLNTMTMLGRPSDTGRMGSGIGQPGDPCPTLTKAHSHAVGQPIARSEELTASVDLAGTIQRGGDGGRHDGVLTPAMAVRRLTPVECERLQGFPDGYTDIRPKGKDTPDGPRYKALGNSMAVPVMRWIGERIYQLKEKNT